MVSTHNTLIVIGDITISTNIKPAKVRRLQQFSRATGISLEDALNRGIELFMNSEAPVYRAEARQRRRHQHA